MTFQNDHFGNSLSINLVNKWIWNSASFFSFFYINWILELLSDHNNSECLSMLYQIIIMPLLSACSVIA